MMIKKMSFCWMKVGELFSENEDSGSGASKGMSECRILLGPVVSMAVSSILIGCTADGPADGPSSTEQGIPTTTAATEESGIVAAPGQTSADTDREALGALYEGNGWGELAQQRLLTDRRCHR